MTQKQNLTVEHARYYLRPVRGFSIEAQREVCMKVAKTLGVSHPVEYLEGDMGLGQRSLLVRQLRDDEVVIISRLDVLPVSKLEGKRPLVDFTAALSALMRACVFVIDASTGTTSLDGLKWDELVEWYANRVAMGRTLSRAKARAMARRRHERAPTGAVDTWLSPSMAAERERWAQCWRDPAFLSAEAAYEAMPEDVRKSIGSIWSARKIFGRRFPGTKNGRPAKPPRMIVYFVQPGNRKQVKIGTTRNVKKRMNGLKHPLLGKLRALAIQAGGRDVEKAMHKRFAEYRIKGNQEWFRLEGELLAYIKSVPKFYDTEEDEEPTT